MSGKANPAVIGAFVLAALAVFFAALALLGSGKMFRKTQPYVLFFEGSLSGLDTGAPVEYRGVRVGSVTDTRLEYNTENGEIIVPVYIELEEERLKYTGGIGLSKGPKFHIERGLRAQLQSQSVLTGKLKVMLIERPGSPVRLVGGDPHFTEIPTVPSLTESLVDSLEQMPLIEIVSNVHTALQEVTRLLGSAETWEAVASLRGAVEHIEALSAELNRSIPPLVEELTKTSTAIGDAAREGQGMLTDLRPAGSKLGESVPDLMSSVRKNSDTFLQTQKELIGALSDIRGVLKERTPAWYQVQTSLQQISDTAQSLEQLFDYLQQHPEALLTGKSPP